jgi:hypothetical protein
MTDTTPSLGLPLIQPAQAQKHVTHNEALARLDTLTQPVAQSRTLTAPPTDAQDGDTRIVATGATGDWAGQDGAIAVMQGGAWQFLAPAEGWLCWIADEAAQAVFDGSTWSAVQMPAPENLPRLGIATGADLQNPLSVAGPGTLLTHAGDDHRLTLNKAAPHYTASLVLQTGFSGRAEIGLTGDDDLHLRVSPDGTAFQTGIVIEKDSGRVSFPAGGGAPRVAQLRNSDTATDLNTAILTDIPVAGVADILDSDRFAVSGDGIACLVAGRVRVTGSLHVTAAAPDANLNLRIAVNGTALPGGAASGHISGQNGHGEASLHLSRLVEVAAGDVVTLQTLREAATGPITMTDGNSLLLLEQW